jgi:Fe-S cluster assembly ATP-binding protein
MPVVAAPTPPPALLIEDLHVAVDGREILRGVDLSVEPGRLHALMGPNGSGKSTLANTLLGNPAYSVTRGRIEVAGTDITDLPIEDRAALGLFLGFQHPEEIPGVSVLNFLRQAIAQRKGIDDYSVLEVRVQLLQWTARLGMDSRFQERYLNEGFSGGEKKRNEVLQMALFEPSLCILDEMDSGLDIDALRIAADGVNALRSPDRAMVVITHYQRLLNHIVPDKVHVLSGGRIRKSGGKELAEELEQSGYADYAEEAA